MTEFGQAASNNDSVNPSVHQLIEILGQDCHLTSIEIAEALWLSLQMQSLPQPPEQDESEPSLSLPPPAIANNSPVVAEADSPAPESLPSQKAAIASAPSPSSVGLLPPETLPIWIADPSMIPDALAIIRAIKPLLRSVEVGLSGRLNEAATVDYIARTQLWLPILEPEREPWFDLVLVVDRGVSMQIWQRLIVDLKRIFRRYGAFRDLQVFDLVIEPDAPMRDRVGLKSHPDRPSHHPKELIEQRGQRIVVVLSDCAGSYWWDGTLLPMLKTWAAVMPTVIWQMLPEWMWERTALGRGTPVSLRNDVPGAANQRLLVAPLGRDRPDDFEQRMAIPVVTSEARDLKNWSLMLAGDRREATPGILLPSQGGIVPQSKTLEEIAQARLQRTAPEEEREEAALEREINAIAQARVQRFRQLASPQARRLVMLLAAAPVITLPVMRLIRDSMLYEARSPLPVAEVFLSGLLQQLPGQAIVLNDSLPPEESVQYDFVPQVRDILLSVLPEVDTLNVINSVSAMVEQRWNQFSSQDFKAFLFDPQVAPPAGLESLRSFANITADILESLGGQYADFAQRLRTGTHEGDRQDTEFPNIPPLEEVEIQVPVIVMTPDLPPIEMHSFEVATITLVEPLEVFDFRIATVEAIDNEWVVNYRPGKAKRFLEPLDDHTNLEMVFIPGGEFIMGSPEYEEGHSSHESPQRKVKVPAFFMGRYPITQAQWRVVANLPLIERELDATPSRHKGDNLPVERVSWFDAVEFCARLSQHTGNKYRLPSEAEWEYACRAGTTTPFHFGETITIDLANYRGIDNKSFGLSGSYGQGPKGIYRETTTPIDQFGAANAYGFCDVHGNVWEWCADHWHDSYEGAPKDGSIWSSSDVNAFRVIRGGSWNRHPRNCRSAYRLARYPYVQDGYIGFRVVCDRPDL